MWQCNFLLSPSRESPNVTIGGNTIIHVMLCLLSWVVTKSGVCFNFLVKYCVTEFGSDRCFNQFMNDRHSMYVTPCRDIGILTVHQMASKSEGCDMYVPVSMRMNQCLTDGVKHSIYLNVHTFTYLELSIKFLTKYYNLFSIIKPTKYRHNIIII